MFTSSTTVASETYTCISNEYFITSCFLLCINRNQISLIQRAIMIMRERVCQIGNILKSNKPAPPPPLRLKGTEIKEEI